MTWSTLLVYVDDALAFRHSPGSIMKDIGLVFDIKDNKYGTPTAYLGDNVEPFQISDRKYAWSIQCDCCVVVAVQMIKYFLSEDNRELNIGKRPQKGPLSHEYNPELDVMGECDAKHMYRFQKMVGILRWAVELGRIDIQIEVTLLLQYQALPQEVHLEALYLIFHFMSNI